MGQRLKILLGFTGYIVSVSLSGLAAPSIEITNNPAYGSLEDLAGRVAGVNTATCRVAVVIYVPGAGWWSKPYCNAQLTSIQPNGSWVSDITTGGSDAYATKITALLVPATFVHPCVEGAAAIPSTVLAEALATATLNRPTPGTRWIQFSGYDWWVKASPGQVGPGPNYFSDSTENVWVDGEGRLHLRITNRGGQWQCAEIVSARSFGYGSYRFDVGTSVNYLNVNAVLGLFTWSDDAAFAHREIDVECSRWGNAGDANNSQFVVQPWDIAGHLARYSVPGIQTNSTHLFQWETNRVVFQALRGPYQASPPPASVIKSWNYTLTVPVPGDENVRLNLWLRNGLAPTDGQPVECVINSFVFSPPGTPQPARLINSSRLPDGTVSFELAGEVDRRYRIERGDDLLSWEPVLTLLATNASTPVSDTPPAGGPARFYRAVTLP